MDPIPGGGSELFESYEADYTTLATAITKGINHAGKDETLDRK